MKVEINITAGAQHLKKHFIREGAIYLIADLCCEESNQVMVVNKGVSQSVRAIFDLQMRKCIGLLYIVPMDWSSGALRVMHCSIRLFLAFVLGVFNLLLCHEDNVL